VPKWLRDDIRKHVQEWQCKIEPLDERIDNADDALKEVSILRKEWL